MPTLIVIILASLAIALLAAIYLVSNRVFNVAVKARVSKKKVMDTNAKDADRSEEQKNRKWLETQIFQEQQITSFDGLKLFGRMLYANTPTNNWVVVCHGFSGNGLKMGSGARHFHSLGYNVLLPDLRGCGNSQGKYLGMGWLDSQDMLQWLHLLCDRNPHAKIVLMGGSMGGATVMMTTGLALPPNVVAAIEDCGYTSVWEEFTHQLKKVFGLPQFPFMHIANYMAKRRAGYSFKEASSLPRLRLSKTPTLFIHGTADAFVPFFMHEECYAAAACPKEKLVIEGAGHAVCADVAPQLYWQTVDAFLEKYV